MQKVPILTLNDGGKIPQFGLGTAHNTKQGVQNALKLGYRFLDCAHYYTNQKEVGEAIKSSGIPRDQLFISSKVWKTHMSRARATQSLKTTLTDLGVDYLDLLLIHWPYVDGVDPQDGETLRTVRLEVWNTFIKFKQQGKVKHIGVSNFLPKHIDQLIEATGQKPVVNQIIHHPYVVLNDVIDYCKKQNILVQAWSPLAAERHDMLEDPTIVEIAKKHKKTAPQVILRWVTQSGYVTFPKSQNSERLKENMSTYDFKLTEDQMKKMDNLHNTVENVDVFQTKDMRVE